MSISVHPWLKKVCGSSFASRGGRAQALRASQCLCKRKNQKFRIKPVPEVFLTVAGVINKKKTSMPNKIMNSNDFYKNAVAKRVGNGAKYSRLMG